MLIACAPRQQRSRLPGIRGDFSAFAADFLSREQRNRAAKGKKHRRVCVRILISEENNK
jgi:hypothetical protein